MLCVCVVCVLYMDGNVCVHAGGGGGSGVCVCVCVCVCLHDLMFSYAWFDVFGYVLLSLILNMKFVYFGD